MMKNLFHILRKTTMVTLTMNSTPKHPKNQTIKRKRDNSSSMSIFQIFFRSEIGSLLHRNVDNDGYISDSSMGDDHNDQSKKVISVAAPADQCYADGTADIVFPGDVECHLGKCFVFSTCANFDIFFFVGWLCRC